MPPSGAPLCAMYGDVFDNRLSTSLEAQANLAHLYGTTPPANAAGADDDLDDEEERAPASGDGDDGVSESDAEPTPEPRSRAPSVAHEATPTSHWLSTVAPSQLTTVSDRHKYGWDPWSSAPVVLVRRRRWQATN